jgi:hypothetical protein
VGDAFALHLTRFVEDGRIQRVFERLQAIIRRFVAAAPSNRAFPILLLV